MEAKKAINKNGEVIGTWVLRLNKDKKIWITTTEAAKLLGVSPTTIFEFIRTEPKFPYRNVGVHKKIQVHRYKMMGFIEERTRREKEKNMPFMSSQELMGRFGR